MKKFINYPKSYKHGDPNYILTDMLQYDNEKLEQIFAHWYSKVLTHCKKENQKDEFNFVSNYFEFHTYKGFLYIQDKRELNVDIIETGALIECKQQFAFEVATFFKAINN